MTSLERSNVSVVTSMRRVQRSLDAIATKEGVRKKNCEHDASLSCKYKAVCSLVRRTGALSMCLLDGGGRPLFSIDGGGFLSNGRKQYIQLHPENPFSASQNPSRCVDRSLYSAFCRLRCCYANPRLVLPTCHRQYVCLSLCLSVSVPLSLCPPSLFPARCPSCSS